MTVSPSGDTRPECTGHQLDQVGYLPAEPGQVHLDRFHFLRVHFPCLPLRYVP
ncbi:hypothetical protein [Streptomyces lasiicapitis]|uniref:hypothetical protein n=1 Tax=Streptomyces lasiicapitis TaxID=1923961 RepID=UPI0036644B34